MRLGNTYFLKGLLYLLGSLITSNFNDLIMKGVGETLPAVEIIFWRFLLGTLFLFPFIKAIWNTEWNRARILLHSVRGLFLFMGMVLWCYGLKLIPLATATVLSFTIPLYTLPLASNLLKEKVSIPRWMATLVGFVGVSLILFSAHEGFSWVASIFIGACILFALLDVINKKYTLQENITTMLFGSAFVTTLLSIIPTYLVWITPTLNQLCLLGVSALGANLVIYFLLKAFRYMDLSAIAPFRYLEFPLSISCGYLFFGEFPTRYTFLGTAIIIPVTLFISLYELYGKNKQIN